MKAAPDGLTWTRPDGLVVHVSPVRTDGENVGFDVAVMDGGHYVLGDEFVIVNPPADGVEVVIAQEVDAALARRRAR